MADVIRRILEDNDRERLACAECGFIGYESPKIVVGVVASERGRLLLRRRSIDARRGVWTFTVGYMGLEETAKAGAKRKAREEAGAGIALGVARQSGREARDNQDESLWSRRLDDCRGTTEWQGFSWFARQSG